MHALPLPSPVRPKLAVLIDAENVSHRIVDKLFEEIFSLGEACIRRIYGDFSSPALEPWKTAIFRHTLLPQHHVPCTTSKNGADIALTIDAMDLLHQGGLDGFCLVSSDSDFTRLAARLRETGAEVYGFGEKKTPKSLQYACNRFVFVEGLCTDLPEPTAQPSPKKPAPKSPAAAIPLIRKAIAQLDGEDDWFMLNLVGQGDRLLRH
ncbi:MAG: hypothetical protein B7Z20_07690 [Sphingobium sp. 32-64-5]|nr:MAG: hypothetical protein B7Z20_07690 [Sphingobium sp. 32-64-5]